MGADSPKVLVVEDDLPGRRFLRTALSVQGFGVVEAATAAEAMTAVTTACPDVLLLDLGLPDGDGVDLTRQIRQWSSVPVVVISARGREADKVEALDAGADDYLTKPFGTNELLARIRVALRHRTRSEGGSDTPAIDLGPLHLDLDRRSVLVCGQPVHLTPLEYRLLTLLARNAGRVLTHRQILTQVWGPAYAGQTQCLRVSMVQLRRKVEADPARPQLLVTEPGVGYRMREPQAGMDAVQGRSTAQRGDAVPGP